VPIIIVLFLLYSVSVKNSELRCILFTIRYVCWIQPQRFEISSFELPTNCRALYAGVFITSIRAEFHIRRSRGQFVGNGTVT
jgi:hypothetical protein